MQIDRAKSLAVEYGKKLVAGAGYDWNLYESNGQYIDTLHEKQILDLEERDYEEFYLKD